MGLLSVNIKISCWCDLPSVHNRVTIQKNEHIKSTLQKAQICGIVPSLAHQAAVMDTVPCFPSG